MPGKKAADKMTAMLRSTAIYLLALALLTWAGLDVYQRYQFYQVRINKQQTQPTESNKILSLTAKNTKTVAKQYLFGRLLLDTQPVVLTQAPATKLNLKLIGVIAASEDGVSKVIIQIGNSNVDVYSVGDTLPKGNATIEKIEATQVLLRRNGKLESLAIIRPELENNGEIKD
ncbi:putative type II secretion protein GspC [bacterium BMS3Bbin11]|nr:putative type II secretion protein GspC [bacterium BMS3Abin11]GBE46161.1 putative type II secretion protein GspC [bacterium BMS3Bbin11]HDH15482.1 hypothetical protein [Gammaproteobacteria bacterium]